MYEIDPTLKPTLPDMSSNDDQNNCIDPERYVRVALNMSQYTKTLYSSRLGKSGMLPRLLWLDKSWTLKQAHEYVFHFVKEVLAEWIDWKDPATEKKPKSGQDDLRTKDLIDFPYRPAGWPADQAFTKKDFLAMDSADAFAITFPGLFEESKANADGGFAVKEKPYALLFKNISGNWAACEYCGQTKCDGCLVPFTDDSTIEKVLKGIKQESANSFYSTNFKARGKELILNIVWHQDIHKHLFSFLATAIKFDVDPSTAVDRNSDI